MRTWRYRFVMEVLGWLGIACILGAFAAASFMLVAPDSFLYPFVNAVGAAALIVTSWYKRFYQLVVLNVVWLGIALAALGRVWFG